MGSIIKNIEDTAKTHLNNIMQIAVFTLNDNVYYGINVSKIRSFEDFKRYRITKNSAQKSKFIGSFIEYQQKIIPVVNIEKWLDVYKEGNEYLIYLVCEFNRHTVAFPIRGIENIYNVEISKLQKPDVFSDSVTYNAIINIHGVDETCMVLDVESMIHETFGNEVDLEKVERFKSERKEILIAEDSKTAREIIHEILEKAGIKYKIFEDGQEIIEHITALKKDDIDKIGLVITDLEMPRRDGFQVIKAIKESQHLKSIPVVVNSSMSNAGVDMKTKRLGADGFVVKTDPEGFISQIMQHAR